MKPSTARFNRDRVRSTSRQVKDDGAKWFVRNSVIFARLYKNSQRKKGWFFAMKARFSKFFVDKVEPKLKSAGAMLARFKLWLTGRLAATHIKLTEASRQSRKWLTQPTHFRVAAIVATVLVVSASVITLWQWAPTFRTIVKTLTVTLLSILTTLGALLKGLGLTLREGLSNLRAGSLSYLSMLRTRFTRPIIKVIVVARPTEDPIPVPPIDGLI